MLIYIMKGGYLMPELCGFYGTIIKMIFNGNGQYRTPYLYVYFNKYKAFMEIGGKNPP